MEEVTRRLYWMAMLAVVTSGTYVAYRLGLRAAERSLGASRGGEADAARRLGWAKRSSAPLVGFPAGVRTAGEWGTEAEEAPTGGVATVPATMDSSPATRYTGNGSAVDGSAGNGSTRVVQLAPDVGAAAPAAAVAGAGSRRQGLSGTTLAAIATVVGIAAIGLGAWAVALSMNDENGGDATTSAIELQGVQQVVSLLSKPSTERIPLQGSAGKIILVVGARGYGVLVLDGLTPAPAGKSYQAWVIRPSAKTPQSAAVFSARDVVVPLTTRVPPGGAVAITLEKEGGVPAPTQTPKLVAERGT